MPGEGCFKRIFEIMWNSLMDRLQVTSYMFEMEYSLHMKVVFVVGTR